MGLPVVAAERHLLERLSRAGTLALEFGPKQLREFHRASLCPAWRAGSAPSARPATLAVDQAHCKLNPPFRPSTSSISPTRYSPGHMRDAIVAGSISSSATPPAVASAWLYPRLPVTGSGHSTSARVRARRSARVRWASGRAA